MGSVNRAGRGGHKPESEGRDDQGDDELYHVQPARPAAERLAASGALVGFAADGVVAGGTICEVHLAGRLKIRMIWPVRTLEK